MRRSARPLERSRLGPGLPRQSGPSNSRPRAAIAPTTSRLGSSSLPVPAEAQTRLTDLARATDTTLYMVLQAALATLLTRHGAGEDIPIGTPIAGRHLTTPPYHPQSVLVNHPSSCGTDDSAVNSQLPRTSSRRRSANRTSPPTPTRTSPSNASSKPSTPPAPSPTTPSSRWCCRCAAPLRGGRTARARRRCRAG
ncbi:hypothetical protein H4N49_27540 [Streptomyces sp. DHE17-7]|nr:hypothetical protein [Streptomyces sp. DHE17-7]